MKSFLIIRIKISEHATCFFTTMKRIKTKILSTLNEVSLDLRVKFLVNLYDRRHCSEIQLAFGIFYRFLDFFSNPNFLMPIFLTTLFPCFYRRPFQQIYPAYLLLLFFLTTTAHGEFKSRVITTTSILTKARSNNRVTVKIT